MKTRPLKTFLSGMLGGVAAFGGVLTLIAASGEGPLADRLLRDPSPPAREASGQLLGYAAIVQKVSPSVVSIYSTRNATPASTLGSGPRGPGGVPSPLERFFGEEDLRRFFGPGQQGPMPEQRGAGSGVILTADGYVLTNNHVVEGADEITVAFGPDNTREFAATVVGTDPQSDLAVLKIEGTGLPAATVGDSDQLLPGDTVLAIGNPFGLKQTVTSGIVSATGRSNLNIAGYENFIQTDASINPGNSGGALIDNRGRVVGINTAIFSRTGGNIGIGFAIPVNMAVSIAESLIENGEVVRGYLGVMLGRLTPDLAEALGVEGEGVLVNDVLPGTPASEAGIEDGDVIVSYAGKPVQDMTKLRLLVSNTKPGSTEPLIVIRSGEPLNLEVRIGKLDAESVAATTPALPNSPRRASDELFSGVKVSPLTPDYRSQLRVPDSVQGVIVTEVDPSSPAASSGLQTGQIITEIDRRPVSGLNDAREALERASQRKVLVRVATAEGSRYLAVDRG